MGGTTGNDGAGHRGTCNGEVCHGQTDTDCASREENRSHDVPTKTLKSKSRYEESVRQGNAHYRSGVKILTKGRKLITAYSSLTTLTEVRTSNDTVY